MKEPAELADVLAGIALLEAEADILRTLNRYGHAIDAGRDEDWIGCFTPDGAIDVHYGAERVAGARLGLGTRHVAGVRHEGHDALRVFIAGHTHPPAHVHQHVLVEPRVSVSGETGTGSSYMIRIDLLGGTPKITTMGRYVDRYRKVADREWLIAERIVLIDGQRLFPRTTS